MNRPNVLAEIGRLLIESEIQRHRNLRLKAATLHNNLGRYYLQSGQFDRAGVCFGAEDELSGLPDSASQTVEARR